MATYIVKILTTNPSEEWGIKPNSILNIPIESNNHHNARMKFETKWSGSECISYNLISVEKINSKQINSKL